MGIQKNPCKISYDTGLVLVTQDSTQVAIPACKLHGYSLHQNLEEKLIRWDNQTPCSTVQMMVISHLRYRKEKKAATVE